MLKIAVFIFSFFLVGCDTQIQNTPKEPGVRNAHGFVYDEARQSLLLFGGASDEAVLGDTWSWNPDDGWKIINGASPGARTFPAMDYFPPMDGTILFGGNRVLFGTGDEGDTFLNDTWLFKDDVWSKIEGAAPPPRAEASITYDSLSQRLIMFGGYKKLEGGSFHFYNDTWVFTEGQWQQILINAPHPQSGTAMVFDESLGKVFLLGRSEDRSSPQFWALGENGWEELPAFPGDALYGPTMVFDKHYKRLVVFGGYDGTGRSNITWVRKNENWKQFKTKKPVGRNHTMLAYDSKSQKAMFFGGHDGINVFGDLWLLNNEKWELVNSVSQKERVANDH